MKKAQKNLVPEPIFYDDFDATIIKSWFGFEKGRLNSTTPSLIFTLEEKNGDRHQVAFNAGIGWQIVEGGHRVEHSFRRNFVTNSTTGCLLTRVIKNLDMPMWERGNPTEADVWIGLKFHWKMETIDLVEALPNGKTRKPVHLMPTKFLGGYEFSTTTAEEELLQLLEPCKEKFPSALFDKLKDKTRNIS